MRKTGTGSEARVDNRFHVAGMDCAECVATVEETAKRIPGIQSVRAELTSESISVEFASTADEIDAKERLARALKRAGYELLGADPFNGAGAPRERTSNQLLRRFFLLVSGVFAFVVIGEWFGLIDSITDALPWWIAVPAILALAYPRLKPVFTALVQRRIVSHTLMTTALIAALVVGEWATAAILAAFMHIGAYAEHLVAVKGRSALKALAAAAPREAVIVDEAGTELARVPAEQVSEGDLVRVRTGDMVPVDGVVIAGQAVVNQSALTGESIPVEVEAGSNVLSASQVESGGITVRTVSAGADSIFGHIMDVVRQAEASRGPTARIADSFSAWYLPVLLGIAAATWIIGGELMPAIAVLAVACSCSFALATPIAMLATIARSAKEGLLVRGGDVIERAYRIDTVLLDKTGTLTTGRIALSAVELIANSGLVQTADDALALAASAEYYSEHPVASALVAAAEKKVLTLLPPDSPESNPGGVTARIHGRLVRVGSARYLGIDTAAAGGERFHTTSAAADPAAAGLSAFLEVDSVVIARFEFTDPIRPESAELITLLKGLGIPHIEMLTGDGSRAADEVARTLDIQLRKGLLPADKLARTEELMQQGHRVVFIGDGINDAPSLARADVGIATGSLEAALHAADVVLLRNDMRLVGTFLQTGYRTMHTVFGNIGFTTVYNVLGVSLAAVGILPPVFAAALQVIPDIGVLANSSRLARPARTSSRGRS